MSAASASNTIPAAGQGNTANPILGSVALCLNIPLGPFSISLCL
jgi:hypothetical protein